MTNAEGRMSKECRMTNDGERRPFYILHFPFFIYIAFP